VAETPPPLLFTAFRHSCRNAKTSRLLKTSFGKDKPPTFLYASLLDYTFGSASLVLPQPAQPRRVPGALLPPQQVTNGLVGGPGFGTFFSSLLDLAKMEYSLSIQPKRAAAWLRGICSRMLV
jgi:hypothetical protein